MAKPQFAALAALKTSGSYVYLHMTPASKLAAQQVLRSMPAELQPIFDEDSSTKLHLSMMWCKSQPLPLPQLLEKVAVARPLNGHAIGVDMFGPDKTVLVLLLAGNELYGYHDYLKNYLSWDSDYDYQPHIALGDVPVEVAASPVFQQWVAQVNGWLKAQPLPLVFNQPAVDYSKSEY